MDFGGILPVETVTVRFYRTTCPGQGILFFPSNSCRRLLLQSHLKLPGTARQVSSKGSRGKAPGAFRFTFPEQ